MNIRSRSLLLLAIVSTWSLTAETGAGISSALLSPPVDFDDPFTWAMAGGVYLQHGIPAEVLPSSSWLVRADILFGQLNSQDVYFSDSYLIAPGIGVGLRQTVLSTDDYRASLTPLIGYRHYFRSIRFNGVESFYADPILFAAGELGLFWTPRYTASLRLEYDIAIENILRHSIGILFSLGGIW